MERTHPFATEPFMGQNDLSCGAILDKLYRNHRLLVMSSGGRPGKNQLCGSNDFQIGTNQRIATVRKIEAERTTNPHIQLANDHSLAVRPEPLQQCCSLGPRTENPFTCSREGS